jgi:hypothetical protein
LRLLLRGGGVEIDERAEHLQIGDKRVHFGQFSRLAVEIADLRLGITRLQCRRVGIGIGLCRQIVIGRRIAASL